jgi:hypothetical protein
LPEKKEAPRTLSSLETPEQPSPELFKAYPTRSPAGCELHACAMPMA